MGKQLKKISKNLTNKKLLAVMEDGYKDGLKDGYNKGVTEAIESFISVMPRIKEIKGVGPKMYDDILEALDLKGLVKEDK